MVIPTPTIDRSAARATRLGNDHVAKPRVWIYAVVVVVIVAAALVGVLPRWPGLAQEVALPPLDFFADVRVLAARATSTPAFVLGVLVALVARGAVLAAVIGFSRRRFGFAVRFYLVALVPALLSASLDFSGRAILYAYLIWAGLIITVIAFGALGATPWMGRDSLRRAFAESRHQRLRLGALIIYLLALAVVGAVWRRPGDISQVLIVPFSGGLTALAATRLSAPPQHRLSTRGVVLVAFSVVLALVALAIVVPRLGGDSAVATRPPLRPGSLLLIAGVDTNTGNGAMFRFDPHAVGFSCRQTFYYSYRGPGHGGPQGDARCPIRRGAPYGKPDTTRPLRELTAALQAQLVGLPRPVVIVTHSQGGWIAWSGITTRAIRVQQLVMLAPFNEGLAPYPRPGANGPGAAGGLAVRLVTDIGRSVGISRFDPDAPLARELPGTTGAVERLVARRLPRPVRAAAVIARGDLPLEPRAWPHGVPEACPGWLTHPGLPTSAAVTRAVNRFLDGHPLGSCPAWIAAIGHTTDAFGAPPPRA